MIKVNKVEAWETQDGSLFKDKEKAMEYDEKNYNSFKRKKTFEENKESILDYINENLKEDLKNGKATSCYYEGDWGWDCESKDSPIDKCIYSYDLFYGDDGCVFCGEPEERK